VLSNAVSVYVALYVKARVAPIVEKQEAHHESIRDLESSQVRLWEEIKRHGEDQANLRGQCQGCKVVETVTGHLERIVTTVVHREG
jgi:predicted transcriptional regulator